MTTTTRNIGLGTPPEEVSLQDHLVVVGSVKSLAEALPAEAVVEPNMPMPVYISECTTMIVGAKEHFEALSAVGYTAEMLKSAEDRAIAAISAQAVWNTERRGGHSESVVQLIAESEQKRDDLVAASALALRKNPDGLRRLDMIREGDSIPDMIADLGDLAVLLTDAKPLYQAINLDVDAEASAAAKLRDQLQGTLAHESVAKSLSGSKEMRDRIYTLSKEALAELREFASFAFRNDKTDRRRNLFVSAYQRRTRRKRRREEAQAQQTAAV
jgi:hypothetical protein